MVGRIRIPGIRKFVTQSRRNGILTACKLSCSCSVLEDLGAAGASVILNIAVLIAGRCNSGNLGSLVSMIQLGSNDVVAGSAALL